MKIDLMLDALTSLIDKSHSQIQQIFRKNKSLTYKISYLSLNLHQLKFQIIQWLISIINHSFIRQYFNQSPINQQQQPMNNKLSQQFKGKLKQPRQSLISNPFQQLKQQLQKLKTQTFQQVAHMRLHTLLKSKLNKLKKESFINSAIMSHQSHQSFLNSYDLTQLQQSVILLEKDMNIEQQQQDLQISAIINKSKYNLNSNPLDVSTISQTQLYLIQQNQSQTQSPYPSTKQSINNQTYQSSHLTTLQISKSFNFNCNNLENQPQIKNSSQFNNQTSFKQNKDQITENEQKNAQKEQKNTGKEQKNTQNPINQNQVSLKVKPKIMKKKKKLLDSSNQNTTTITKQDLLGNLLEQTYNQHFMSDQTQ